VIAFTKLSAPRVYSGHSVPVLYLNYGTPIFCCPTAEFVALEEEAEKELLEEASPIVEYPEVRPSALVARSIAHEVWSTDYG
jgi:hypothetical protein